MKYVQGFVELCFVWVVIHFLHDDVIKRKHFLRYWAFVWGIHRSPVNSTHKGQWRGALIFFICAWTNGWFKIQGWVNKRDPGDLRRHRAHYDVTAMFMNWCKIDECQTIAKHKKASFTGCMVRDVVCCASLPVKYSRSGYRKSWCITAIIYPQRTRLYAPISVALSSMYVLSPMTQIVANCID